MSNNQYTEPLLDKNDLNNDLMNSKQNNMGKSSGSGNLEPINILCFNIAKLSRTWQFLILTFATFAFYLLYGYVQELMYKLPGFNNYAWYLTLVQFLFYTIFGSVESKIRNELKRKYVN